MFPAKCSCSWKQSLPQATLLPFQTHPTTSRERNRNRERALHDGTHLTRSRLDPWSWHLQLAPSIRSSIETSYSLCIWRMREASGGALSVSLVRSSFNCANQRPSFKIRRISSTEYCRHLRTNSFGSTRGKGSTTIILRSRQTS